MSTRSSVAPCELLFCHRTLNFDFHFSFNFTFSFLYFSRYQDPQRIWSPLCVVHQGNSLTPQAPLKSSTWLTSSSFHLIRRRLLTFYSLGWLKFTLKIISQTKSFPRNETNENLRPTFTNYSTELKLASGRKYFCTWNFPFSLPNITRIGSSTGRLERGRKYPNKFRSLPLRNVFVSMLRRIVRGSNAECNSRVLVDVIVLTSNKPVNEKVKLSPFRIQLHYVPQWNHKISLMLHEGLSWMFYGYGSFYTALSWACVMSFVNRHGERWRVDFFLLCNSRHENFLFCFQILLPPISVGKVFANGAFFTTVLNEGTIAKVKISCVRHWNKPFPSHRKFKLSLLFPLFLWCRKIDETIEA